MKKLLTVACFSLLCGSVLGQSNDKPDTKPAATQPVTLINIDAQQAVAEDLFIDVIKQAGLKLEDRGQNAFSREEMLEPIDYSATDKPFWDVMRDLCNKYNVQVQMNNYSGQRGGGMSIMLQPNPQGVKAAAQPETISEGCWIKAIAFTRNQSVNFSSDGPSSDQASIQCMVYLDPAIKITAPRGGPRVTEAVDDNGNSLVIKGGERSNYYGGSGGGGMVQSVQIPLKYPAKNAGSKITSLKFSVAYRVALETGMVTLDKLDDPTKTVTAGDYTFSVKSFKKVKGSGDNENYEMTLQVIGGDERNEMYTLLQTAVMLDDKGKPYPSNGMSGGGSSNGMATYTFRYNRNTNADNANSDTSVGPPTKWQLEMATKTRTMVIPVELKDLPLP